jgi:hypothetical protein
VIFTAATAGTNSTRRHSRPAAQPATGRGRDGILDRHDVSQQGWRLHSIFEQGAARPGLVGVAGGAAAEGDHGPVDLARG